MDWLQRLFLLNGKQEQECSPFEPPAREVITGTPIKREKTPREQRSAFEPPRMEHKGSNV